jgi:beta-glucanase (GH16 family)
MPTLGAGRPTHEDATVMNHSVIGRRKRTKHIVLTCLIVALLIALVSAMESVVVRKPARTVSPASQAARKISPAARSAWMAPPAGYSAGQLIFDDRFSGTSLNSAHWNTFMDGQGDSIWNANGLPAGDSAAGTYFHHTYFSPSQVTVDDGLTLTMVPDTKYSSLGYSYRSGVVTTGGKFALRSGYVQIKAKMSETAQGGWPAIWFIDPGAGGGSQEIDLQEGGFTPTGARLPSDTPVNNIFTSTYHAPSGKQWGASYATPKPMNAGFNIYGMEYIPGRSIKTYFNGKLVGWFTGDISTTPYEIIIWNTQASASTWGFHTTGVPPDPSEVSVAEVQVYSSSNAG